MRGGEASRWGSVRLAKVMLLVAVGMFGFGYALVPFYNLLCDVTGFGGKVGEKAIPNLPYAIDYSREVSLELVTSVNEDMPLQFRAEVPKIKIHPGQYYTVNYYGVNIGKQALVGRAIPTVAPGNAARYLKKTECFCFSKQDFAPGKDRTMPVRFVVEPTLPADIKDMTLAYTFFDVTGK
ncbi:MAG TPA: cytochrome c oxidase assembly protein [Methylococcaceae bacterium]|nr:cytochrome c oxidase assembly protein [Methylococcaceae bacterium]